MNIFFLSTEKTQNIVEAVKSELYIPRYDIASFLEFDYSLALDSTVSSYNYDNFTKCVRTSDLVIVILDESLINHKQKELLFSVISRLTFKKNNLALIQIDETPVPSNFRNARFSLTKTTLNRCVLKTIKLIKNFDKKHVSPYEYHSNTFKKKRFSVELIRSVLGIFTAVAVCMLSDKFTSERFFDFWGTLFSDYASYLFFVIFLAVAIIGIVFVFSYLSEKKEEFALTSYQKKLEHVVNTPAPIESIQQDNQNKQAVEIKKTPTSSSQPSVDALELMLINLGDIKEFYKWSQKQAKSSFVFAIIMCILGFLLITSSIVLPLVFKTSVTASIISAIGGTVTESIALTSLFVYRASINQLNYYHKALHEDERFLSSINLIDRFNSPETYEEMLKEIIRSEIQLNLMSTDTHPENAKAKVKVKTK